MSLCTISRQQRNRILKLVTRKKKKPGKDINPLSPVIGAAANPAFVFLFPFFLE